MPHAPDAAAVASLFAAAQIATDAEHAAGTAAWVADQLERSRIAFDARAFEAEPAGFTLALRRDVP